MDPGAAVARSAAVAAPTSICNCRRLIRRCCSRLDHRRRRGLDPPPPLPPRAKESGGARKGEMEISRERMGEMGRGDEEERGFDVYICL